MWKLSITTTPEAEEAISEELSAIFDQAPSSYTDLKTRRTVVAVYLRRKPANLRTKLVALRQGLTRIRQSGLKLAPARIRVSRIARADWAESWKRHFKPIEIGGQLLIKPSWSKRRPRKGQATMVLDPGLSFGTGHHPTTLFCLRELVRRRRSDRRQAFLDLGTGSGILAIAAAKLGYLPIHAIDFDPESVRAARANAHTNRMTGRMRISRRDLASLPHTTRRRYDLICANLLSTLLVAERRRIVRRLNPGGVLVIAGILRAEFAFVARHYVRLGLRQVAARSEGEWRSGAFAR